MFRKNSYTKTDKKIFLVCFLVAALAPFFVAISSLQLGSPMEFLDGGLTQQPSSGEWGARA